MPYAWKVDGSKSVSLKDFNTGFKAGLERSEGEARLVTLSARLGALQEKLYAAGTHAVLVVLQGTDTSGKDGTVAHVMANVNPQGCRVTSFKAPTEIELAHDFLWRIHAAVPPRGTIGIFNRSHYEDVLIVRVRELQPRRIWEKSYDHINAFEQLLVDNGTIVLKFFLHISKDEQASRFRDREREPDKRWKLDPGDYEERKRWDEYQDAYRALLERCGTKQAPWYVVAADHKWFRNLAVAEALVDALAPYEDQWERDLRERGEQRFQELQKLRREER